MKFFILASTLESGLFVFRAHWFVVAFKRGHDGVPGQNRAFHPRGIFMYPSKDCQFANITLDVAGHNHFVNLPEHFFHVGFRFALREFREQRCRGLGDATARTNKADVLDFVAIQSEKEFQLVAAKRVVTLGRAGRLRHFMEIPRFLAVVQNDLLVKVI